MEDGHLSGQLTECRYCRYRATKGRLPWL